MSLSASECDALLAQFAESFRVSARHDAALRQVVVAYLQAGLRAGLSQGELIDFLGVSSPSVLDQAGYADPLQDQVMTILGGIFDNEINA